MQGDHHLHICTISHPRVYTTRGGSTDTQTRTNIQALSTGDQKREYWVQTVTKATPKALRCTHV